MIKIVLKIIRQRYKNCANRQIFLQKTARMEADRYWETLIRYNHQMNSCTLSTAKVRNYRELGNFSRLIIFDVIRFFSIFNIKFNSIGKIFSNFAFGKRVYSHYYQSFKA